MWSQHSHLMMADVTNNTNRYGLKLLEINGITSLGTIFPLAFCLMPREDTAAFTWCFEQLRDWMTAEARQRELADDAFIPHVIITDYDAAERAALAATFPEAQLQVCTWHIMKNIATHARKHWQGDDDDPFELNREEIQRGEDPGPWTARPGQAKPADFIAAFQSVLYAPTAEEFDDRWNALISAFLSQERLVGYLNKVWYPVRQQWARAWVRWYRNWGHTTTSPCESLHSSSRSFIRNGQSNLLALYEALCQQRATSRDHHDRTVEREAIRTFDPFRLPLYNAVMDRVSYKSLELVQKQARAANSALLNDKPLEECTNSFTSQYGLPCKHIISEYLQIEGEGSARRVTAAAALPLSLWDQHWLLRQDIANTDPYRRIRDPRIIARRGIIIARNRAAAPPEASSRSQQQQQLQRATTPRRRRRGPAPAASAASTAARAAATGAAAAVDLRAILTQLEAIQSHLGVVPPQSPPPAGITIVQTPVEPASYRQPQTVRRSEAATLEMRRIPSSFERFEPPPPSQGGARRGYHERTRVFTLEASATPLSTMLPSIEGGFSAKAAKAQRSPARRRGPRPLLPYESVWQA
ncbi:hypothetical protein HIM_12697 [Hirsutella minnesotensis 3608]|uniref:MULE transposase domain-containing protein n=1 Tax=Hirsutella minnesotensis 3608 TaxID=1043627 RepID=A0A0F7ZZT1_9HYPO|nr:hypothetical protein HIM_12697 [Hirsutella minnesotensis 3608]